VAQESTNRILVVIQFRIWIQDSGILIRVFLMSYVDSWCKTHTQGTIVIHSWQRFEISTMALSGKQ